MPEMTISDAQAELLESLRAEIQAETRYGYVRKRDALQYLIDNVETDEVDVDFEVAPPSETDDEVGDDATEREAAAVVEEDDAAVEEAAAEATDDETGGEEGTPAEAADGGTTTTSSTGGSMPDPADDDAGDDRLDAMMNLLDTHEDKWREASKEDARYEVDMPDGTTQYVQTKDDVRAHLFKNY